MEAAGIESEDDTELRLVLAELGLDFESLALSPGAPRARDISHGLLRAPVIRAPGPLQSQTSASGSTEDCGLAVNFSHLADLYSQASRLEGGELLPIFEDLLKRDRAVVTAGKPRSRHWLAGVLDFTHPLPTVSAVTSQKETTLKSGQSWPPASRPIAPQRWRNSNALAADTDGVHRRRSSVGSAPSVEAGVESDYVDDERPDIFGAAAGNATQRRSASVGGLARGSRPGASGRRESRSTAALGPVAKGKSRPRQRTQADRSRGKTTEDDDLLAQKKIALARTQAAYDGVLRYTSQIVLSEASVLAIIARVLKLRHRIQQTLLNEGQFTLAISLCASLGLVDLPTSDRRLRLRKRLTTVQVSPAARELPDSLCVLILLF